MKLLTGGGGLNGQQGGCGVCVGVIHLPGKLGEVLVGAVGELGAVDGPPSLLLDLHEVNGGWV